MWKVDSLKLKKKKTFSPQSILPDQEDNHKQNLESLY